MLSPGPSLHHRKPAVYRRHLVQPSGVCEGLSNACVVVKEGIKGTAANIVKVAVEEHELKGMRGAVGGVLRQIPPTIVQPVIIASEATSSVLGGMRNQLLPDKKREDEKKWKLEED
ncbi:hypothetical protein NP493_435g00008 [Ridgeia piscesae]|uniref:Autophagy-related protein 2 n=1 Tax=Ridgeia piscesae TaxID=27915 RepID=A0AAD9L062_RIDPI|nr:hypothetical protein NP493_435g00008 [Ridgeia piscesae]